MYGLLFDYKKVCLQYLFLANRPLHSERSSYFSLIGMHWTKMYCQWVLKSTKSTNLRWLLVDVNTLELRTQLEISMSSSSSSVTQHPVSGPELSLVRLQTVRFTVCLLHPLVVRSNEESLLMLSSHLTHTLPTGALPLHQPVFAIVRRNGYFHYIYIYIYISMCVFYINLFLL